jgi:hypothetical protein
MQIDESEEQFQNAENSINESSQSGSNVTTQRDLHSEKQSWQIFVTEAGM